MGGARPWDRVQALRYPGMSVDPATWTARFGYQLAGPDPPLRFTETVVFPPPEAPPDDAARAAWRRVLELLYVAAGTSYYKAAAPRQVRLDSVHLPEKALSWATALFRHGLAEFAYTNDLPHVLDLPLTNGDPPGADDDPLRGPGPELLDRPPLVPVGGGKDSLVTVEALRGAGLTPVLMSINPEWFRADVLDTAALPQLRVTRRVDPYLLELNQAGAYNGHIPVTSVNSLVAVATAVLHGLGPVVMSNERSASVANLPWHGQEVNHQWSKGLEAEQQLRDALAAHAGLSGAYFSLLRPLSELHIAKLFARFPAYDAVVTSCNAAFRMAGQNSRWCRNCPKCRFVFLALAPFLPRHRLVGIFGGDLLADETQLPGYRELTGITRHKPFECVGEPEESLAALRLVADAPEWTDAAVVRQLRAEVAHPRWLADEDLAAVFRPDPAPDLPAGYARALHTLVAADHATC